MKEEIRKILELFNLEDADVSRVSSHEGGRNIIYICEQNGEKYVLRISDTGDREEESYLAETEFVHYLAQNGASVADVHPSVKGNFVEKTEFKGREAYVSLFDYAKGMLISDNGYEYREGAPLSEYFYNTGKTLGKIHELAKAYHPEHKRMDYSDKYNMPYINTLIPDEYAELKKAISKRLDTFSNFTGNEENYGLVHFDFSDGNYHIDMNSGDITVFDFDNCMYCWYMFDLANLWTHGIGWIAYNEDREARRKFMEEYFDTVLEGYRSETALSDDELSKLPLYIDMVLVENIVDEFECCLRAGEELDYEDIEDAAEALINNIPYAGFC
ncbi:MAG: phosphotransferase [Clostridia bacterium]|nr:phosphotransferase [Clostridia bacterium]